MVRTSPVSPAAPAALVLETARTFDLRSTPLVRAIFWLRARILGAKAAAPDCRDERTSLGI